MNIVLACSGTDWVSIARLAKPLRQAGFTVIACCPVGTILEKSGFLNEVIRFPLPATPERVWLALRTTHQRRGSAFVVPGDEAMVKLLRDFVRQPPADRDDTDRAVVAELAASLGAPERYEAVPRKSHLSILASGGAWRFPPQALADHTSNLFEVAARIGYPLAVKRDFTAGGVGVYRMASEEALASFVAGSNVFVRQGPRHASLPPGVVAIVQKWITGRAASVSLAALRGQVLASFAYAKLEGSATGVTSVAEVIDRPDLTEAAHSLVGHFGFTGFAGVDAIIEDGTDLAYVLEFNARPTMTSHLGAYCGADLCEALHAALTGGTPPSSAGRATAMPGHRSRIAMFPSEWQRDRTSPYLHDAYHDVPWDEPELLKALLEMKAGDADEPAKPGTRTAAEPAARPVEPSLRWETVTDIATVEAANWDRCAGADDPFVSHAFLKLLQTSGSVSPVSGFTPNHFVLRDQSGSVVAAAPMHLRYNSDGEFMNDRGWAHSFERVGRRYYPKLVGRVPLIPVTGPWLLARPGAPPDVTAKMVGCLQSAVRKHELATVQIPFPDEAGRRSLEEAGWVTLNDVQYHWHNRGYRSFDDFLASLKPHKSNLIRRERREVRDSGVKLHTLTGSEATETHWNAYHALYVEGYRRKNSAALLTPSFFTGLGEALGDRVILILAEDAGRWIAGTFCVVGNDRLYIRNWGVAEERKFLHLEVCYYRTIDIAIERGISVIEGGAGGSHKLERGFLPTITPSCFWFSDEGFHRAVGGQLVRDNTVIAGLFEQAKARTPFRPQAAHP